VRSLAFWHERVDHGEEQLGLALENRKVWLAENGSTTLALLNDVCQRQASERDELRDQLVARAHERPAGELADRDAGVHADVAELQRAEVPPAAPDLDVGLDLGP
jgi:hypothetical protein